MRYAHILASRLGRRGGYLLIKAFMFAGLGVSYLLFPLPEATAELLYYPLLAAPIKIWGALWVLASLIAVYSAFGVEPGGDRWGFMALIGMSMLWTAAYLMSVILGPGDTARAFVGLVIFACFSGVVMVAAGWPEPQVAKNNE